MEEYQPPASTGTHTHSVTYIYVNVPHIHTHFKKSQNEHILVIFRPGFKIRSFGLLHVSALHN